MINHPLEKPEVAQGWKESFARLLEVDTERKKKIYALKREWGFTEGLLNRHLRLDDLLDS